LFHRVARFVRSLRAVPTSPVEDAWAAGHLTPGEQVLYAAMPSVDRRHAVDGARAVLTAVPDPGHDTIGAAVEAALVHDVGKRHAHLGTVGRSLATVAGWAVRSDTRRSAWARRSGWRGRVGAYLRHDVVGADEVAAAGGSALAVAWTAGHHDPARVAALDAPTELIRALVAADRSA
jgi:hypothetical protein